MPRCFFYTQNYPLPTGQKNGRRIAGTCRTKRTAAERNKHDEISDGEKTALALNLYYPCIPDDAGSAIKAMLEFYSPNGGGKKSGTATAEKRIYDFDFDAPYIYAAFRCDYGIDLTREEHLHWWVFRALFTALNEQNMFCRIMSYRAADLKRYKGEERRFYTQMQKKFAIPLPKNQQEKLDAVSDILLNGGDLTKMVEKSNGI